MGEEYQRTADVTEQREIEAMIAQESDAKIRLQLMVMNRINQSLIANTRTINEVARKLDAHLTNFESHTAKQEAIVNKGKGAWLVLAFVLGVAQCVGVWIFLDVRSDLKYMHDAINTDQVVHAKITARVEALEKRK